MGHKVHPYGFRLGVSRTWTAKWYADKEYTDLPQGGHHDPQAHREAAVQRQRQRRRDRARHQPRDGDHPHRQAGHRHRQGRRQRRGPAPADRRAVEPQGQAGDQGDPPAGAGRPSRGHEHRRAADPPHRLQEGDEAGHPALDEGRREGRQDRRRRPPRWLGDGPPRVGQGRAHPAGHAPRGHQLRPGPRPHDLRPHRRQGLDLSRRHRAGARSARPEARRARPRPGRGSDRC